jgi:hypothetical protein
VCDVIRSEEVILVVESEMNERGRRNSKKRKGREEVWNGRRG